MNYPQQFKNHYFLMFRVHYKVYNANGIVLYVHKEHGCVLYNMNISNQLFIFLFSMIKYNYICSVMSYKNTETI